MLPTRARFEQYAKWVGEAMMHRLWHRWVGVRLELKDGSLNLGEYFRGEAKILIEGLWPVWVAGGASPTTTALPALVVSRGQDLTGTAQIRVVGLSGQ